jgi:signal transduction histidine kinase/ligand-binding sensor domain-containing protein/DNA-binding response OmpR family regulator
LINKIYQDAQGVVWIATEDGLNRYDGAKFTVFRHRTADPHSLISNYVRTLYEDSKGRFFVGTLNGLQLYDRATEQFRTVSVLYPDNQPVVAVNISNMLERANGEIYVTSSGHGVFRVEEHADSIVVRQLPDFNPSKSISAIYEDSHGYLWMATTYNGVYRIGTDLARQQHYSGTENPTWNNISAICEDRYGTVYLGSLTGGLFRYDADADHIVAIPCRAQPDLPIKTLYPIDDDRILIGTDGSGMKMYHIRQHTITDEQLNISLFNPRQAKIHSILKDRAGNLWCGLFQKGVLITPSTESKFHYIGYKSATSNIIGSGCVMAVCRDHTGTLWIGTDNDGIYAVRPDGTLKVHFAPDDNNPYAVPSTIMSIFEDSRHNLWLGSYLNGMARLDTQTGRCRYFPLTDDNRIAVKSIYAFAEDKHGQLWIGTMGSGLFKMDLHTYRTQGFFGISTPPNADWRKVNALHNAWINCLLYTPDDDRLYIGTFDGMGCLDVGTFDFVTPLHTRRILRDVVYALHRDRKGDIWAGTVDGLKQIKLPSKEVRAYTQADGLPSDMICSIQSDEDSVLWITTGYGMSRFDPVYGYIVNFYADDGLQGNEFSRGAACSDPQGRLIFGGMNGVTYFDPEEIDTLNRKPEIRITDFYLHNRAVRKGMRSGGQEIINTAVTDAENFHLSHRDNSFSIELSAMEFYGPEHVTYLYSLNDNHWTALPQGVNSVSFGDLQPGTYRFRFQAKEHTATSNIKEITVLIAPAWYASPGAKLAYTLLALALLTVVVMQVRHRIRAKQERLEHQHAKQINEAKLQFFTDISHEIRTPMTLIISPLQTLMATDRDNSRSTIYRTIYLNAERILLLVNQLLDVRKIDRGQMRLTFRETDLTHFVGELYAAFLPQAQSRQITMRMISENPEQEIRVWIDPAHFDKVVVNVLSNAMKFTPQGGEITLTLRIGSNPEAVDAPLRHFAEIMIDDSGVGIASEELDRIFERFYQARNQTASTGGAGTGIGLHLCRSIMTLHHGTIRATANDDRQGTRFIICLPLGNAHLAASEMDTTPADNLYSGMNLPYMADSFLPAETANTESPADNAKSTPRMRRHLLVVEDDEGIRKYLYDELKADYYVRTCCNGKEALEEILKQAPDLVISDIMMPEMDGLTLCRKIKQNVRVNYVPVILLTAKSREEDNLEGLAIGADAYIIKPFSMDIVKKTVANLIAGRKLLRSSFSGNQLQTDKLPHLDVISPDEQLMERVMKVVNDNLSNPDLTVDILAEEVGLSRIQLYRKLKNITNQAPSYFIRNVRLKQAATLLAEKHYNVSEVADLTGFNSPIYFSMLFKETYGMSPKEWMAAHL